MALLILGYNAKPVARLLVLGLRFLGLVVRIETLGFRLHKSASWHL